MDKTLKRNQYQSNGRYKIIRDLVDGTIDFSNDKDGFVEENPSIIQQLRAVEIVGELLISRVYPPIVSPLLLFYFLSDLGRSNIKKLFIEFI